VGFTIDLKELAKYVPVSKPSPRTFAHVLLLHYIMIGIADGSLKNNRDAIISLIHDRSEYDSVLLDAFNILAEDESYFAAAKRFCSIAPMSWEQCIPLQQADLLAYENYKESRRSVSLRDRRKSLNWILERGQLGGFLKGFNAEALTDVAKWFDALDARIRESFLRAARIPINPSKSKRPGPDCRVVQSR
jgi:hypothetical protein